MEEYADIYYVDTRNADPRDHRTNGGSAPANWRPSAGPANTVSPSRTVIVNPPAPAGYAMTPYVRPMAYPAAYQTYPAQPFPGQSPLAGLFGSMPVGQILEMVAMAFAALAPLPAAPTATRDGTTDVGNLILYQGALAQHAKRDEQIRTIGNLVAKLVA